MSQTIEGTYKNGVVSLDHLPEGVTEARVVVDFVEQPKLEKKRGVLKFGMFATAERPLASDQDIDATKHLWNRA